MTNRGSFSSHPTTLGRLRRHARDAKRGLVLGASVFRERDNMWLPLREVRTLSFPEDQFV